ncbi:MAG: tryptophan synthase subunit alpha [Thermodesulfobacteriota bacterium]|nr:tryptophan synthase subunit alpha [Thermodesulfobacteriota bacterium]
MNRINTTFAALAEKNEKALVGFVTAGDPDIDRSRAITSAMCRNGVDILELGVPFSDPTADGPVIQRSSQRALEHNTTLATVLEMTADLRKTSQVPVILFSYYNPIYAYGIARFYDDARAAGADGVLVVDLPPEESGELTGGWNGDDFALIRLIAPTTPADRIATIANDATGFLYVVSMTGVTGSSGLDTSHLGDFCARIRKTSTLPLCVGFGISTPEDVAAVAKTADGVVIGSAFERLIEEHIDNPDIVNVLARQTAVYKAATRPADG